MMTLIRLSWVFSGSGFSGVMLAVGRLVRIEKTIGDKVISRPESTFYSTFDYFGYDRQVGESINQSIFV